MERCPIFCILPPYMVQEIIEKGTPEQRAKAIQTAQINQALRAQRNANAQAERVPSFEIPGPAVLQRRVFTAGNRSTLPGQLVRAEGAPPTADPAANEAYDGAGATYGLYWEVYGRNSIDDAGMSIDSTVHYQVGYDNAFWNGVQMVYGDGDEDLPAGDRLFNRFTISLDIIGHELAHGVTQFTGNLAYANQSGALNESFSDVFGSLVRQRALGQTASAADWIIGAGLFTPKVNGVGIRSMKAPGTAYNDPTIGKDPQPAHMRDYVTTLEDNGGVHINSGIPNHAFYRAAVEMGGFAWEKAGRIWYETLTTRIKANTNFQTAANETYAVAAGLFGAGSLEQKAVAAGWNAVGIQVAGGQPEPPPVPGERPGCLAGLMKSLGLR